MSQENEYDPPGIGTISPLRSKYATDVKTVLIEKMSPILEQQGLIEKDFWPPFPNEVIGVRLSEYGGKFPVRKHERHWIDGGEQIAVFHPETYLPFFLNPSGSKICKLCDGEHDIQTIINQFIKEWSFLPEEVLVRDLLKFLLLLEELDLIEFVG
jgi:hypothetical protein